MADIFREVDEDVRRDKALEAWTRYQPLLIMAALAIILTTVGWRTYEFYRIKGAEAVGAQYEAALKLARGDKPAEAQAALAQIAATGPDGYRMLAGLRHASEIAGHDAPGGVAAFDALIANPATAPQIRDIARLRSAILRADEADLKEMTGRLAPIAASGQPLRHTARQILALTALRQDDLEAAGRYLDEIVTDTQSPESARRLALELQGLVQGAKPVTAPK